MTEKDILRDILIILLFCVMGFGGEVLSQPLPVSDEAPVEVEPKEAPKYSEAEAREVIDLDNIWADDTLDTPLWIRFVRGILRSRSVERPNGTMRVRWERCGAVIEKEHLVTSAIDWVSSLLDALAEVERETGVKINPWGAFATTAHESSFNECGLSYAARRWASVHVGYEMITETWRGKTVTRRVKKKVVEKFRLTYDRDTVWRIITHEDYADGEVEAKGFNGAPKMVKLRNKFDGGPYQIRRSIKRLSRESFDELLSVEPGLYMGVKELARRAKQYKRSRRLPDVHPHPWNLWQGPLVSIRLQQEYGRRIAKVARWLGAHKGEIYKSL